MAFVFSPLPFFFARQARAGWVAATATGVLGLGAAVAYGRILAGAHYLTDCLFAAGAGALLSALLVRVLVNRMIRKSAVPSDLLPAPAPPDRC
jgi:membrane-associated phospholipid phosphatase